MKLPQTIIDRTRYSLLVCSVSMMLVAAPSAVRAGQGVIPKDGFVPSSTVASRIAEDILVPIYGQKQISSEKPFRIELHNGIWRIKGNVRDGMVGGEAEVHLKKSDGQILYVSHAR